MPGIESDQQTISDSLVTRPVVRNGAPIVYLNGLRLPKHCLARGCKSEGDQMFALHSPLKNGHHGQHCGHAMHTVYGAVVSQVLEEAEQLSACCFRSSCKPRFEPQTTWCGAVSVSLASLIAFQTFNVETTTSYRLACRQCSGMANQRRAYLGSPSRTI